MYTIYKSDGTPINIPDGSIFNDMSIPLLGRLTPNYGQSVASALVKLLENFYSETPPEKPTNGQLWFDSSEMTLRSYVPVNTGNTSDLANWRKIATADSTGSIDLDSIDIGGSATFRGQSNFDNVINLLPNAKFHGNILPDQYTAGIHVHDIGSTSLKWGSVYAETFYGTAIEADYADLAERYEADAHYAPGTIVSLGGEKEITASASKDGELDLEVFGVISTDPALKMNASAGGDETHPFVALAGRIPVTVKGKVKKSQRIVASDVPGVGVAYTGSLKDLSSYAVVGRALEDKDTDTVGNVMVAVGAK